MYLSKDKDTIREQLIRIGCPTGLLQRAIELVAAGFSIEEAIAMAKDEERKIKDQYDYLHWKRRLIHLRLQQ